MTGEAALVRGDALRLPLADETVDLVVTSPPYWSLRSYRDDGEHFDGQIGSEPQPQDFLCALWAVMDELWRALKPEGVCWVNLGDKRAGSGGHNNAGVSAKSTLAGNGHIGGGPKLKATRRTAPDRYNQSTGGAVRKSKMGLPWRFALGCYLPDPYRTIYDPGEHPQWVCRQDQIGWDGELVWSKPNGLPESVTDRTRDAHEYWFMLTKRPDHFAAVDEIREPYAPSSLALEEEWRGNPLGKIPGSVWQISPEPLIVPDHARERYDLPDHFAAFPQEWPRRLILGWSPNGVCQACGEGRRPELDKSYEPQGDGYACACPDNSAPTHPAVILDPFVGTGTTVLVARTLGRTGIGIDLSASYLRLARWRVWESGHGRKVLRRTNEEAQEVLPL